jgi:nucleoside-diphosphate-sugar epimerase
LKVLGSGTPLRQFCFATDLSLLILWSLFFDNTQVIALVPEQEHTILELAQTISEVSGVEKGIILDPTSADG